MKIFKAMNKKSSEDDRVRFKGARPNHETVHEAVRHRTDFEKLCSNHTIKQYAKHHANLNREMDLGLRTVKLCQQSNTQFLNSLSVRHVSL